MLDPCEKGSESDGSSKSSLIDNNNIINNSNQVNEKKTCADCGTTKTPLWRGGPAGPKSLCNACGIRSRKKRRAVLGINKDDRKPRKTHHHIHNNNHNHQSHSQSSSNNHNSTNSSSSKLGESLKERLMAIGREVLMRRSTVEEKQRKKLGEEEQAAVLLMALSYGSVYA